MTIRKIIYPMCFLLLLGLTSSPVWALWTEDGSGLPLFEYNVSTSINCLGYSVSGSGTLATWEELTGNQSNPYLIHVSGNNGGWYGFYPQSSITTFSGENPSLAGNYLCYSYIPAEDPQEKLIVVSKWVGGTTWQPIGQNALNPYPSSFGYGDYPNIGIGNNGNPYVTWLANVANTTLPQIYEAHWDGNQWVQDGGSLNMDPINGTAYNPKIDASSGIPYITWVEINGSGSNLYVKHWNGSAWVQDGGYLNNSSIDYTSSVPSIAVFNGMPYVCWSQGGVYVKHFDGNNWIQDGGNLASSGNGSKPNIVFSNGVPYVSVVNGSQLCLEHFNGNAWVADSSGLNVNKNGTPNTPMLCFSNGTPYLAWSEGAYLYQKHFATSALIDNFDNDNSYNDAVGQRDAQWYVEPTSGISLNMGTSAAGNVSPYLSVQYNKPISQEWASIQVGNLIGDANQCDFAPEHQLSMDVLGNVQLLVKFQDWNGNQSENAGTISVNSPNQWIQGTLDYSGIVWDQCDPHHIQNILLFPAPGVAAQGSFCLDNLRIGPGVPPPVAPTATPTPSISPTFTISPTVTTTPTVQITTTLINGGCYASDPSHLSISGSNGNYSIFCQSNLPGDVVGITGLNSDYSQITNIHVDYGYQDEHSPYGNYEFSFAFEDINGNFSAGLGVGNYSGGGSSDFNPPNWLNCDPHSIAQIVIGCGQNNAGWLNLRNFSVQGPPVSPMPSPTSTPTPNPLIDNFDNDGNSMDAVGQRDAQWWVSTSNAFSLGIGSNLAGNTTPYLTVSYNKAPGDEWAFMAAGNLSSPGNLTDFSTNHLISVDICGTVKVLIKFQDVNGNQSYDAGTITVNSPNQWALATLDYSNIVWGLCDSHHIQNVYFFAAPGLSGQGSFCLDNLTLGAGSPPPGNLAGSPTITPTVTMTKSMTITDSPTQTMTISPTITTTPTMTQTGTVTVTLTSTPTPTPSLTMTKTATITRTATRTPTFTRTPTATRTATATATPSRTATATATATAKTGGAQAQDYNGQSANALEGTATAAEEAAARGISAYPNPAKNRVTFTWQNTSVERAKVEIFNVNGERVAEVTSNSVGNHLIWTLNNIASGIYFYQIILTVNGREERQEIKKIAIFR
jgi:hypothetical protein